MQIAENARYRTVIEQVKNWPVVDRLALIEDILRALKAEAIEMDYEKGTLDTALGLLATDKPAPTDETIQKWLSDHKEKDYD
jgi:hypothetical protein